MYFGSLSVDAAMHFLNGVRFAVASFGGRINDVYSQVMLDHGFDRIAMQPCTQMVERGMAPAAIIDEMLALEIEALRRSQTG
jgi:hypothetical protein